MCFMKRQILFVVLLIFSFSSFSQDWGDLIYLLNAEDAQRAAANKEETRARIQQTKEIYHSSRDYPSTIIDGWHKVIISDNYTLCKESKVYVVNNQITKVFLSNNFERRVSFTGPIRDAKAVVKVTKSNGQESNYLDVYFIDDIISPNSGVSAPQKPGQVCFYSDLKWGGTISVNLEGYGAGELTTYFQQGQQPNCGQKGTLTFTCKSGEYAYGATNGNRDWGGRVTVTEGHCSLIRFGK